MNLHRNQPKINKISHLYNTYMWFNPNVFVKTEHIWILNTSLDRQFSAESNNVFNSFVGQKVTPQRTITWWWRGPVAHKPAEWRPAWVSWGNGDRYEWAEGMEAAVWVSWGNGGRGMSELREWSPTTRPPLGMSPLWCHTSYNLPS